jgi:hypothetical protein
MKPGAPGNIAGEHSVEHERTKMHVEIQRAAEPLDDDDGAAARGLDADVTGVIGQHAEHGPRQNAGCGPA